MYKFFINILIGTNKKLITDLSGNSWKPHELSTYNTYYNSYPYSSANTTPSVFNYNFTNASNSYNIEDQSSHKPYTPPGPYLPNAMNSMPYTTTSAQQYSSSPGASSYTNSQFSNANAPTQEQSREQCQNAIRDSNFPELLLQAESQLKLQLQNISNDELRKISDDDDFLDEFLARNLIIQELDTEIENKIDLVEEVASKFLFMSL